MPKFILNTPCMEANSGQKRRGLAVLLSLALLFVTALIQLSRALRDPDVVFLSPENGAHWIRYDAPTRAARYETGDYVMWYRVRFVLDTVPDSAPLTFRTLRTGALYLDRRLLMPARDELSLWKQPRTIDLAPYLSPGAHELAIQVLNRNGHPAVLAYCPALGLHTGPDWRASSHNGDDSPVQVLSGPPKAPEESRWYPRAYAAVKRVAPWLLLAFATGFGLSWLVANKRIPKIVFSITVFRWTILSAWALLAVNNLIRYPFVIGFDAPAHFEYIEYVRENLRVPLATDGWQMFQSPLYYIIAAVPYALFDNLVSEENMSRILRSVSLLCGLGLVEISFRTIRRAFPNRPGLHAAGLVLTGFMPMTFYMTHGLGNEPLAAVLTALAIYLCTRHVPRAVPPSTTSNLSPSQALLIGAVLGLALLAKVSAVLVIPPTLLLIIHANYVSGATPRQNIRAVILVLAPVILIAGWYYARNWLLLGRPFVGGWDPARGIVWWQDPAYRNLPQFLAFGQALRYPVQAAMTGLWDALYSTFWLDGLLSGMALESAPPWNLDFMIAGAWIALPLTLAIIAGAPIALLRYIRRGDALALYLLACPSLYLAAIAYLYLEVPAYSAGKASYALAVLPCLTTLALYPLEPRLARPPLNHLTFAVLAAFSAASYAAYFIT